MKLFKKLMICFLGVCIVPLVFSVALIYRVSARNMDATYMELAEIFNSQIITNMDEFLREYDQITKSMLVNFDVISSLNQNDGDSIMSEMERQLNMRKIMVQMLTLKPEIRGIILVAANGRTYHIGANGETINDDILKEQKWLQDFQKSKYILSVTAVHDQAYYDEEQDGLLITVCRRILDYKGSYVGELLIDLEPGSLIQLNDSFLLVRNEYNIKICIRNHQNELLFDSDVVSGRITWKEAMEENDVMLYERSSSEYIVMQNESKNGNLKVATVIPRSDLLFRISRVKYITYGLMMGCIVLIILISAKLSGNIANPVRKLQDKMKKVESGQYEVSGEKTNICELNCLVDSYNNMVERIRELIEKVYVSEIKQKNAKLLALQTQINPHMLFNTLEAIRMKALINDEDEIADMIQLLTQMFRMVLSDDATCYKVGDDIEYAEKYIELQNIRLPNMFFLEIQMDDRIKKASIIPLVIQPLVENCIAHGYRGGMIPLNMVLCGTIVEQEDILLTLQDDGKGMTKEQILRIDSVLSSEKMLATNLDERGNSIGLWNISERIRLQYGEQYYIHIVKSDKTGTVIEIRIPGQWKD